ncbi:MAG: hypothetical protein D6738_01270 [Acidobacteria bacterium]|nr:MAG: hypothetical protein D6738_01270 [Acidobacteriota bacterium]
MTRGRVAVLLAACAVALHAPRAQDAPEAGAPLPTAGPLDLARSIPPRLRTQLFREPVAVRVAGPAERRAAAAGWIGEALAALASPACREVLGPLPVGADAFAAAWPEGDPVAPPDGAIELLVPETLPALGARDVESLETRGVIPFEIMLAGEWARAVARRHAGPPPADPLLRQARAARLEGVARLAGIALTVQASGLSLADLGQEVLRSDADEAGWPRAALVGQARDPVVRAALRAFAEDGLRWAAFHFLRGGVDELIAAIERPGVRPSDLLGPGRAPRRPALPEGGCRIGPRPAAALLVGDDDPLWVDELLEDRWRREAGGGTAVSLRFETEEAAAEAAADARRRGWEVVVEGAAMRARRDGPPR